MYVLISVYASCSSIGICIGWIIHVLIAEIYLYCINSMLNLYKSKRLSKLSLCYQLLHKIDKSPQLIVLCDFLILHRHENRLVVHRRKQYMQQIVHFETQTTRVDTWMTAHIFILHQILVHQKLYVIFLIVHQSKHAHGTRCDIQVFLHISILREGKSGYAKLLRDILRLELLMSR